MNKPYVKPFEQCLASEKGRIWVDCGEGIELELTCLNELQVKANMWYCPQTMNWVEGACMLNVLRDAYDTAKRRIQEHHALRQRIWNFAEVTRESGFKAWADKVAI